MGSSLFDAVKGRGFFAPSREQESSLSNRLLTFGEETEGEKSERGARLYPPRKVKSRIEENKKL